MFTNLRPVRVRVTTLQEGKPVGEAWRARLRKAFDFCDRDGDGFLSALEAQFAYSDIGTAQLLANGAYQPGRGDAPALPAFDRDGDGKVSFEEFVASYPRAAAQVIRVQSLQPDVYGNAQVTEAIFKLIDADGDGKLTKAEVNGVEKLLATRDADEDECLTMQELAPNTFDPNRVRQLDESFDIELSGRAPDVARAGTQTVVVYDSGKVPGTVTQQVIKRYDKDNDFELTKAECGFDDATFAALDRDANGQLDGEELDVWRTGAPDVSVTLSLAPKSADCVAKLADEKGAAARGFALKQTEGGRLVLHVGLQTIDFAAFAPNNFNNLQSLKTAYAPMFNQAAGDKGHVEEKDLNGPNAVRFQFLRVVFDAADRDADGKLTRAEFEAYFDLQESFRNVSLSITPSVQTPTLFQLLDENRDGRLSVRELRTAWARLSVLEGPGAEVITRNIIRPVVSVRLSRTFDRGLANRPQVTFYNPNQIEVPSKGPVWFRKMDRNGDGDVSRIEFVGSKAEFDVLDTDGDDLISLAEAEAYDKKTREKK